MLSSAVSFAVALTVVATDAQLDGNDARTWKQLEPSIVRVMSGNKSVGSGVLIDSSGNFLAHRSVSGAPVLFGRLSNGEMVQLSVVSIDEVTQLVLLRAEGWKPVGRTPVSVQSSSSPAVQRATVSNATRVLLVTSDATVRGELTQSNLVGVMAPSRRGMTLAEIRFEDPGNLFGGGLVFTLEGRLVGVVGATLDADYQRDTASEAKLFNAKSAAAGGGLGSFAPTAIKPSFGPGAMTIGYTVTPDILERVVEGFRSPSRTVRHPALGLMCQDSKSGGALVVSISAGSVAQQAGIRPGDVLLDIAGTRVVNQLEYTRILVRQKVGETITVKIRRGAEEIELLVKVGQ